MPEMVRLELTPAQAEALTDAANCLSAAAEGDLALIMNVYMPEATPLSGAADRFRLTLARHAQDVAQMVRAQLDDINKRDPDLQEAMHAFKMALKRGETE